MPDHDDEEPAAYRATVEALLSADPEVGESHMMSMASVVRGKKMFGGLLGTDLVLKLGRARVDDLVAAGRARPFDPSGRGRAMKDWAVFAPAEDWLALAEEARSRIQALQETGEASR